MNKKYKAKRKDNGQWVIGYYVCINEKSHRIYTGYAETDCKTYYPEWYEIIPESLSESTGLTDKKGVELFEGDIVKTQPFYDKPYSEKRKSKQYVGVVEHRFYKFGGNSIHPEQMIQSDWRLNFTESLEKYTHFSWSELWGCEKIGHKYDNPELLTKGTSI